MLQQPMFKTGGGRKLIKMTGFDQVGILKIVPQPFFEPSAFSEERLDKLSESRDERTATPCSQKQIKFPVFLIISSKSS